MTLRGKEYEMWIKVSNPPRIGVYGKLLLFIYVVGV
jgi:hypothetical protein